MKRVITLLMLLVMMIQSSSQLWITAAFFLNRDYISRVLCINKDKPESGCNGACQLKKQIKKDQEKQEKSGIDSKSKEVLVYLPTVIPLASSNIVFEWSAKTFNKIYFSSFLTDGFTHSIFHPPTFIVYSKHLFLD